MNKDRVLLVEDNPTLAVVYREYLADQPFDVVHIENGEDTMKMIKSDKPDVVLLDLNLPDMDGMEILKYIHNQKVACEVVIITAHASVDIAVDAMRYGAFDFITKPFDAKRLQVTVNNAVKHRELSQIVETFRTHYERDHYYGFIGSSLPMQGVYRIVESAAPSDATVFITGESGTGKEVCAEAVHKQSPRQSKPFMVLNCAAIPRDLMESEIFGHVKGAFTGAVCERQGAATQAHGGTLFLDEICEMDLDLQSKLLRFIQTGSFKKVGGDQSEQVDVRFICATNRDPLKEVEEGRFREDLYYRLHVIPIELPPLRDRDGDVLLLAKRFLKQYGDEESKNFIKFSGEAEAVFLKYDWPGNIRQLQNIVRNLVVLNNVEVVTPEILPAPLNAIESTNMRKLREYDVEESTVSHLNSQDVRPLRVVEKEVIEHAIAMCNGNIPKAAALLEISPSTIYRKKQSWGVA